MFQTEVVTQEFHKKEKTTSKQASEQTSTVLEGSQGKNVIQTLPGLCTHESAETVAAQV